MAKEQGRRSFFGDEPWIKIIGSIVVIVSTIVGMCFHLLSSDSNSAKYKTSETDSLQPLPSVSSQSRDVPAESKPNGDRGTSDISLGQALWNTNNDHVSTRDLLNFRKAIVGKTVKWTGVVEVINPIPDGRISLGITEINTITTSATIIFEKSDVKPVLDVSRGDLVTVRGIVEFASFGGPTVNHARLVHKIDGGPNGYPTW